MDGTSTDLLHVWESDSNPRYKTAFETDQSGTANFEEHRIEAEDAMFGSVYSSGDVFRPIYGGLNIKPQATGWFESSQAAYYGPCFLHLRSNIMERCTFSAGDSKMFHVIEQDFTCGTVNTFGAVIADLTEAELAAVWRIVEGVDEEPVYSLFEAHVHGTIVFKTDVTAISISKSCRNFEATFSRLKKFCSGLGLQESDVHVFD